MIFRTYPIRLHFFQHLMKFLQQTSFSNISVTSVSTCSYIVLVSLNLHTFFLLGEEKINHTIKWFYRNQCSHLNSDTNNRKHLQKLEIESSWCCQTSPHYKHLISYLINSKSLFLDSGKDFLKYGIADIQLLLHL